MTDKLKQIAKEEIMKLSKDAQEVISAFDWIKISEEIGKKYLLNESEVNDFQVETFLVLAGLEDAESYARNIENYVGTSKDEAEKITEEANQKIFIPMGNLLEESIKKNLQNKNPNHEQTLNFILSGGDYSAFLEDRNTATSVPIDTQKINRATSNSKMSDLKNKLVI